VATKEVNALFYHCVQNVKKWWGAGVVVCLEHGEDLHMAQLVPLPLTHCLLLQLNPDWF